MTDSGVLDFDEDIVGSGLGDGDLFVDGWSAFLLDYLGPLGIWDGHVGSCGGNVNGDGDVEVDVEVEIRIGGEVTK